MANDDVLESSDPTVGTIDQGTEPTYDRDGALEEMAAARAALAEPGEGAEPAAKPVPKTPEGNAGAPTVTSDVDAAVGKALAARAKENEEREAWRAKERERLKSDVSADTKAEVERQVAAMRDQIQRDVLARFRDKPAEFAAELGADPKKLVLDLAEYGTPQAQAARLAEQAMAQAAAATKAAKDLEARLEAEKKASVDAQAAAAARAEVEQRTALYRQFADHAANPERWPTLARLASNAELHPVIGKRAETWANEQMQVRGGKPVQWDEIADHLESVYGPGKAAGELRSATPGNGGKGARSLTQADATRKQSKPNGEQDPAEVRAAMLAEMAAARKQFT